MSGISSRQSRSGNARFLVVLITALAAIVLAVLSVWAIAVYSQALGPPTLDAASQGDGASTQQLSDCSDGYLSRVASLLRETLSTEELDSASAETVMELIRDNMRAFRQRLEAQQLALEDLERRNRQLMAQLDDRGHVVGGKDVSAMSASAVPVITPEIVRTFNIRQKSEFEVIPYVAFTRDRLYQLEPGLTHRPEDTPRGGRKKEMDEVSSRHAWCALSKTHYVWCK